jgi:hypothetical protein
MLDTLKSDIVMIGKLLDQHRKDQDKSSIKCRLRNLKTLAKEFYKAYKKEDKISKWLKY